MESSDIFVITPVGTTDLRLVIAACRANARGILDLEFEKNPKQLQLAFDQLERFTSNSYGIKISASIAPDMLDLIINASTKLAWVIVAGGNHSNLKKTAKKLQSSKKTVIFEAVSLEEIQIAEQLTVDGLILKGNEAQGRVGQESTFILVQRWNLHRKTSKIDLPVWIQGGIGKHTTCACMIAGASGVVLDSQLLLSREAHKNQEVHDLLCAYDGSETIIIGESLGEAFRVNARLPFAPIDGLVQEEARILSSNLSIEEKKTKWKEEIQKQVLDPNTQGLFFLSQDVGMAKDLATAHVTVCGIITAIIQQTNHSLNLAQTQNILSQDSAFAKHHKTRFPIVQGPMTRVSDTAEFAKAISEAGALPVLALGLQRGEEVEALLKKTKEVVSQNGTTASWGIGLLGFLPAQIRNEQLAAIDATRPPFAIIAGGRPDQAKELEKKGIETYLHVPSPGLLKRFLLEGCRRFVFEGRECGGHVGPRSSFVLWDSMVEVLLEHAGTADSKNDLHILFAGGIHDALSGAMVSAIAASIFERGIHVGVLMGTAYLFTKEAVESSGIVPQFQKEALNCKETVLLQTGPGHAIRCIKTPYCQYFDSEKRRLQSEGNSSEEITKQLEWMNIGRLRIASKGIDRVASDGNSLELVAIPEEEQISRGMYMIGQVASLRDGIITMRELHEEVSGGSTSIMAKKSSPQLTQVAKESPSDIAIIGMHCFYPGAHDIQKYWMNIVNRINSVTEIPQSHWDYRLYYDPNPKTPDKIISKWGGFLKDIQFDPLQYGITPKSLYSIEPLHLFLLESVRFALIDAGYEKRPFNRERTAAILGVGGAGSPMATAYGIRTCIPLLDTVPEMPVSADIMLEKARKILPEWTEDSFPGILLNVAVGRVANRFNFGGANFAIDAACGSSLAALYSCIRELETKSCDLAVAMGADSVQTPFTYMAFSKTHALSPRGRCTPFDAAGDGIVLSEGVGAVILKRLEDAERDGDKIYAVIKGMGTSSDGKEKGLTAPNASGQLRALNRAYSKANISPAQVGLVEAHGTGTVVGDQTEVSSLMQVLEKTGAEIQSCALGSVKSMIGHSKCAAGLAGLIKVALSLHHKILPPTLVDTPNPKANFEKSPLFLNTEARPWVLHADKSRVAGVSSFGFGGTNFHAVLEEYRSDYSEEKSSALYEFGAELFVFRTKRTEMIDSLNTCLKLVSNALVKETPVHLGCLALALWKKCAKDCALPTLAIVATSQEDLKEKLTLALDAVRSSQEEYNDPRGIYFSDKPEAKFANSEKKIAFLFPGQGSQYPNMLSQVAMAFPKVRKAFDEADAILDAKFAKPLSKFIFPPSHFSQDVEQRQQHELSRTDIAQPALGAAAMGMYHLLRSFGIQANFFAGHSYGEYAALAAAGALSEKDLTLLSYKRGKAILEATKECHGAMAAVEGDAASVLKLITGIKDVTVANDNSPTQTVISGTEAGLESVFSRLKKENIHFHKLHVSAGFHSPLVKPASSLLEKILEKEQFQKLHTPVYSNTTASPYPSDPTAISHLLSEHLTNPVRFREQILALYNDGARIFIEVGPQGVLTGLVHSILQGREHLALQSDQKKRPGLVQLQHLLGQLFVTGIDIQLMPLYEGRNLQKMDLHQLATEAKLSESLWVVNSVRCRPINAPEPHVIGQTRHIKKAPMPEQTATAAAKNTKAQSFELPITSNNKSTAFNTASNTDVNIGANQMEADQMMLRFQDVMAQFLEVQKRIMTSYLEGSDTNAPLAVELNNLELNTLQNKMPTAEVKLEKSVAPTENAIQSKTTESQIIDSTVTPVSINETTINETTLTAKLLELVSLRTGYPKDMIGLDLNLEADLGVDSIKRIEILGDLADTLVDLKNSNESKLEMEKLTSIMTIRGIIEYLTAFIPTKETAKEKHPTTREKKLDEKPDDVIERALVHITQAPPHTDAALVHLSGCLVFTDDGRGIASHIVERLGEFGQKAIVIGTKSCDLTKLQDVENLLEKIKAKVGPICGLVHLLPLAIPPTGESWKERIEREVKSLYVLAKALEKDITTSALNGRALLLAATHMGGKLGYDPTSLPDTFFPGQGGIAGFVKSLGAEWPQVLVRMVDFEENAQVNYICSKMIAEMSIRNGPLEVGYKGEERLTWEPVKESLASRQQNGLQLGSESCIVLTGGARGITAQIAEELGLRFKPKLILIGRTALPEEAESVDTAALTAPADIKTALIARFQKEGKQIVHALIESSYQQLLAVREIRSNIERIKKTGAEVHYYAVDVKDAKSFNALIDKLEKKFGGFDGVIHGAGIIEDKKLCDKTGESFDRVFNTKVESALVLMKRLVPEKLKFCVFFSSISSRYGNKGQTDYAAANEILSKLAIYLDQKWPARVFSIAWGPWSDIGMVRDLEKHLKERGLTLISPEVGSKMFLDELLYGKKGESEVVIAGGAEHIVRPFSPTIEVLA